MNELGKGGVDFCFNYDKEIVVTINGGNFGNTLTATSIFTSQEYFTSSS